DEELLDVLDEGDHRAELGEAGAVEPASLPQHERDRHGADRLDEGEERRLELVGEVVRVPVVRVQPLELREGARLAPGERDRRHARDRLLEVAVDAADALADQAVGLARHAPEVVDREHHDGQEREADERERPVDPQHEAEDAKPARVAALHVAVDAELHQVGLHLLEELVDGREEQREADNAPVGPHVGPQAPEEARVVRLAELLLAVDLGRHQIASSSTSSACWRKRSAYTPPRASRLSWSPISTTRPSSSTQIRSASFTVVKRCATRMVV